MNNNTGVGDTGLPTAENENGFSAKTVILATVGGVVAAFVLSWAYGPAEHYSPIIYLNFLLAYGMGWLVGKCCQAILRRKKINRLGPARLVGVISGLAAAWFSWLAYIWVIFGYDFGAYFEALTSPMFVWEVAEYLAENPIWSIGKGSGSQMPAIMYYGIWAAEFICIVAVTTKMCTSFVRENLLCAGCGEWVTETGDTAMFSDPSSLEPMDERVTRITDGDVSALPELPKVEPDSEAVRWLEVKGYACAACQSEDSFVSVRRVELKMNKKTKKLERSEKVLITFAPVDVELEKKIFDPSTVGSAPSV